MKYYFRWNVQFLQFSAICQEWGPARNGPKISKKMHFSPDWYRRLADKFPQMSLCATTTISAVNLPSQSLSWLWIGSRVNQRLKVETMYFKVWKLSLLLLILINSVWVYCVTHSLDSGQLPNPREMTTRSVGWHVSMQNHLFVIYSIVSCWTGASIEMPPPFDPPIDVFAARILHPPVESRARSLSKAHVDSWRRRAIYTTT